MNVLVKDLKKTMDESKVLDAEIKKSLKEVGFDLEKSNEYSNNSRHKQLEVYR